MDIYRIFVEEQEIDLSPNTVITLTKQLCDIAELANRQANYTNNIKAPISARNQEIFGNPEKVQSETEKPYRKLSCRVEKNGLSIIPNGYVIFDKSDEFYNLVAYSGNINFFDLLEGKMLVDLDTSAFDHVWNFANITGSRGNDYTGLYKYPIIDYGKLPSSSRDVYAPRLFPATFILKLMDLIAEGAGFVFDYSDYIKDKIKYWMLAFTRTAFSLPDSLRANLLWDVDRNSDISTGTIDLVRTDTGITTSAGLRKWNFFGYRAFNPYPMDNEISDPGNHYLISPNLAIITTPSRQRHHFKNKLTISIPRPRDAVTPFPTAQGLSGTITVQTDIMRNGYPSSGGTDTQVISITNAADDPQVYIVNTNMLSNWFNFSTGDAIIARQQITVQFEGYLSSFPGHPPSQSTSNFSVVASEEEFNNEVDENLVYGSSTIALNTILPDISQKDLIRMTAYQTAGIFATVSDQSKVYFRSFEDIVRNIPYSGEADNWTSKIYFNHEDLSDPKNPSSSYRFNKYGQRNHFKYKEDEDDEEVKATSPGLGNGFMDVDDLTLEREKNLIEMIYAATLMETKLNGLDVPLIRKIAETQPNDELTIDTEPRILIDDTQDISGGDIHYFDDSTSDDTSTNIPLAYFILKNKAFNLGYNNSLLDYYYPGLRDVLFRARIVTVYAHLDEMDLIALDEIHEASGDLGWFVPKYFEQFNAFMAINKISNHKDSETLCKVELIRLQK